MRAIYSPKSFDAPQELTFVDFGSKAPRRRSISGFLEGFTAEAMESDYLYYSPVGNFVHRASRYRLARYIFLGPGSEDEPIRIGIFAGIHGDEAEGSQALLEFLARLNRDPERARGYHIFAYPICNPSGFEDNTHLSRSGNDLNHEFWQRSRQPEVYYLERELGVIPFHGVISLHVEDANGVDAHSRSSMIQREIVRPALEAAEKILPQAAHSAHSDCPAAEATGRRCHDGVLVNCAEMSSTPFEIVFETPRRASVEAQVEATIAALDSIIAGYRPFLATQQNI